MSASKPSNTDSETLEYQHYDALPFTWSKTMELEECLPQDTTVPLLFGARFSLA